MNFFDLLALVLDNLGRRKTRVALTAVGVVIGTAAVVVLVSLATGLQQNANQQLGDIGDLTLIRVFPGMIGGKEGPGAPSDPSQPPTMKVIDDKLLEQIRAMPEVEAVVVREGLQGGARLVAGQLEGGGEIVGLTEEGIKAFGLKVAEGEVRLERNAIIVGSQIANNFYNPRRQRPPDEPLDLYGKSLKLIVSKYTQDGVEILKTLQVRVVAVLAETRNENDYAIYLPADQVQQLNEWLLGRRMNRSRDGYQQALVKVKDPNKVLAVNDAITALGYQAYTAQSFVQGINGFFSVLQIIFGGVGAIALLVAAIGIANTMAMAILERTREIGLMKAVGATNRDVLMVFLGEAGGIGLIGGVGGVLAGWLFSQVLNVAGMAFLAGQAARNGGAPPSIAVSTPAWLPLFAIGFSIFIGIISGLYPALRAASLNPLQALKYE